MFNFLDVLANTVICTLAPRLELVNEEQIQTAIAEFKKNNYIRLMRSASLKAASTSLYREMINEREYDELSLPAVQKLIQFTLNNDAVLELLLPIIRNVIEKYAISYQELLAYRDRFQAYLKSITWPDLDILDRREHFEIAPEERFLTYFASLLKIKPGLSACTALTIATALNGEGQQLFIACNLNEEKETHKLELLQIIYTRLAYIQEFINNINRLSAAERGIMPSVGYRHEDMYEDTDDDLPLLSPSPMKAGGRGFLFKKSDEAICADADCKELAREMLRRLGYTEEVLAEDDSKIVILAAKVIFATCFDKTHQVLSPSTQEVFRHLEKAVVVLPKLEAAAMGGTKNLFAELYSMGEDTRIFLIQSIPILILADPRPHFHAIKLIHAEQLLVYLLDKLDRHPSAVGISYLCCLTCSIVLSKLDVKFFGLHHKAHEGVLNFYENTPQPAHSSRFFAHLLMPKHTPPREVYPAAGAGVAALSDARPKPSVSNRIKFDQSELVELHSDADGCSERAGLGI
jgi:hypothetical protein